MRQLKNSRRGQIFVVSVIIAVTVALIAAAVILHSLYKETNPDQFLGRYQSAIVDSMNDGDKILLYVDEASKMSVAKAFDEYLYGNPNPLTNVEAGDVERKYCGSYVYRLWNTLSDTCYPDYNSPDFELNRLIDKHLSELTKNPKTSKDYPKEEQYFDNMIRQDVNYRYSYLPKIDGTTIAMTTDNQYTVNVFKSRNTALNDSVQSYLQTKAAYSGSLIWPLDKQTYIESCYGYRGDITTENGIKGSPYHPGLDIPAPRDTAVHAAAAGKIVGKIYPAWGQLTIDHGNGLQTSYTHMNTIAKDPNTGGELDIGSVVTQGQVIGYVGGRDKYGTNLYGNHLHFEVISTTVNPNLVYDGINAVFKNIYVNPLCFIDLTNADGTQRTLSYNINSKACTSTCNLDGSNCACGGANSNKCTDPSTDAANSAPYKFCGVYGGIVSKEAACLKSAKTDWKIKDVSLSAAELTGDQILKVSMIIENDGDTCVAIQPELSIVPTSDNSRLEISNPKIESANVYPKTDKTPQTIIEQTCTFTTDKNLFMKAINEKKCVLYAPDDGTVREYSITTTMTDYNNLQKFYSKEMKFKVKKGTGTNSASNSNTANTNNNVNNPSANNAVNSNSNNVNSNNLQTSVDQLSNSEKTKLKKTEDNLNTLGVMNYISQIAQKEGVPEKLVLGLITVESSGEKDAISPTGAYGLFQVIRSYHEKRVNDECGSWDKFQTDAECQIRVGIGILKAYHDQYGTKGIDFKCSCDGNQGTNNCKDIDARYVDWDAAIRAYNSADCTSPSSKKWADYNFVDTVMKYSSGWGYIDTADKQVKDEMYAGILGTYRVNPRFSVLLNFDVSLFDLLKQFTNITAKTCGIEGIDRDKCIKDGVDAFNNNLPQQYKDIGIILKTSCDTDNAVYVNRFVEDVNDCMVSPDDNCQCVFNNSNPYAEIQSIESIEGSTKVSYYAKYNSNEIVDAYFDYSILNDTKYWSSKTALLDSISLYKNDTQLLINHPGGKNCEKVKSAYRLCLNTRYQYNIYDESTKSMQSKDVRIPFAIMVRDNIAPKPVSGLESSAMLHSNNSVVLKWNAGVEGDISRYKIYLSDSESDFSQPTVDFKKVMTQKSANARKGEYLEYDSIDFDNPVCILKEDIIDGTKYCTFNYSAVDKDKKAVSIQLEKERLYYITSLKKFVYILNGNDTNNSFVSGNDKFVAVTAVDIDGNEIDNIETNQKIVSGTNLITVAPENKLEPGFIQIISQNINLDKTRLLLSYQNMGIYIDGTPLTDTTNLNYDTYAVQGSCDPDQLTDVPESSQLQSTTSTDAEITLTQPSTGIPADYCVYVLTSLDINKYMKGFAINTADIQIGIPMP